LRKIGLHLRLTDLLSELLEKAIRLKSPIFQCFLITQGSNKYARFSEEEIKKCRELSKQFDQMYLHASYWVNLAGCRNNGWRAFQRELGLAKMLGFTHIIIHPGSATGCETQEDGIKCLARALNKALETEKDIKIVLENGAHARMTVGGKISDFGKLLKLLKEPERISFCIDTAHAHSFGYDITDPEKQEIFLEEIDHIIGRDKIALLHLNETQEARGSYIDKHAALGDGQIGNKALQRFMNHPVCKDVPIILEIPPIEDEKDEAKLLALANKWDKSG
jgi:deoxyribonuclease-4